MKKLFVLFSCVWLAGTAPAHAQVNLSISQDSASIATDTFNLGSNASYSIWIKNNGPSGFNTVLPSDTLYIYTAVRDSSVSTILNVVNINAVFGPPVIAAGDSISVALNSVFNQSATGFHKDINVIVIWPYATGAATTDSLEFWIYLLDPNGVNEIDLSKYIALYPNPTSGELSLENGSRLEIESVRIWDTHGRAVSTPYQQNRLDTSDWTPGMYLVEISLKNHQSITLRVIRQ